MKVLAVLVVFSLPFFSAAGDLCEKAVSDLDYIECSQREYELAEARLNETYNRVLKALKDEGKKFPEMLDARTKLIEAQRKWVLFRKDDCDAVFAMNRNGSIRIPEFTFCMSAHAQQRTKELGDRFL